MSKKVIFHKETIWHSCCFPLNDGNSHYISKLWDDVTCPECLKHKPEVSHMFKISKVSNSTVEAYTMCGKEYSKIGDRLTDNWEDVTCKVCLKHKPVGEPPPRLHYVDKAGSSPCGFVGVFEGFHALGMIDAHWENVTCPRCLKHKPETHSLDENLDVFETTPTQLHVRKKGSKALICIAKEAKGVSLSVFTGNNWREHLSAITAEEWPHVRNAIDQLIGDSDE